MGRMREKRATKKRVKASECVQVKGKCQGALMKSGPAWDSFNRAKPMAEHFDDNSWWIEEARWKFYEKSPDGVCGLIYGYITDNLAVRPWILHLRFFQWCGVWTGCNPNKLCSGILNEFSGV